MPNNEQINEMVRRFLSSLPEHTNWGLLSDSIEKMVREERRSRHIKKISLTDEEKDSLFDKFSEKALLIHTGPLEIKAYYGNHFNESLGQASDGFYASNNKILMDWFGYNPKKEPRIGVYLIADFYVGQSSDIRSRLLGHARCAMCKERRKGKRLYEIMYEWFLSGSPMPVTILSQNTRTEQYFIELCREEFSMPLINSAIGLGGYYG